MDYDKLIERLKNAAGGPEGVQMCKDAATAISTLQAENEKLRAELEQVKQENSYLKERLHGVEKSQRIFTIFCQFRWAG